MDPGMRPKMTLNAVLRSLTIGLVVFTILAAVVIVAFPVRPFWIDEWRIIYNLKFRSVPQLWGTLDYMQQFPRLYLSLVKLFTGAFDYRYTALRLPSAVVGAGTLYLAWRMSGKIYGDRSPYRWLFVLLLAGSFTFSGYFAQIKHYTMEIFSAVVAMGQLLFLLDLERERRFSRWRYLLFCGAAALLPFFSYPYPIAIAPVFLLIALRWVQKAWPDDAVPRRVAIVRQGIPLLLIGAATLAFYLVDVRQVLSDPGMRRFWAKYLLIDGYTPESLSVSLALFRICKGPGFFEHVIFWLSLAGFATWPLLAVMKRAVRRSKLRTVEAYAFAVVTLVLILFLLKKIPLGEPRISAFAVPAVAVLAVSVVRRIPRVGAVAGVVVGVSALVCGVDAQLMPFRDEHYARILQIYRNSGKALRTAGDEGCSMLVTPGVAYPYEGTFNYPEYELMPGDWVIRTHPDYRVSRPVAVYRLDSMNRAGWVADSLGLGGCVIAGDGRSYRRIR